MAAPQKERSAKAAAKRKSVGEKELRMHARQGTRTVLAELMEWHGITEQGEAITLALPHLHDLGRDGSTRFFAPPRHKITIIENVSRKLGLAFQSESLRICHDE